MVDFNITIEFEEHCKEPARIFQAMASLVNTFEQLNKELLLPLSPDLETYIQLEDFEKGSLRVLFVEVIKKLDDEALKNLEWKKIAGNYLLEIKKMFLDFMEQHSTLGNIELIQAFQKQILKKAQETQLHHIPHYKPIPIPTIIDAFDGFQQSLKSLKANEKVSFYAQSIEKPIEFNKQFSFNKEEIEKISEKEIITNTSEAILKIKKPDYLGDSMWEFKFENRIISAKISDESWLFKFQKGAILLKPGDALRVKLEATTRYDINNDIIGQPRYIITKVIKTLNQEDGEQLSLLD